MAALFYNDQIFESAEEMNEYLIDQIGLLNDELKKQKDLLETNMKNNEAHRHQMAKALEEESTSLNDEINSLLEKLEKKNSKIRKLEKIITKLTMKIIK